MAEKVNKPWNEMTDEEKRQADPDRVNREAGTETGTAEGV